MVRKAVCPACEKEVEVEPIRKPVTVEVRKEKIQVPVTFLKCKECGYDEIEDKENAVDELELAYREYRKRHNMLQPEEVTALREKYGFSQRGFAKLLGMSPATLSRYETGGLQEAPHDLLLQLLDNPENMLFAVHKNRGLLTEEEKERVLRAVSGETRGGRLIQVSETEWVNPDKITGIRVKYQYETANDYQIKKYYVVITMDTLVRDYHIVEYEQLTVGPFESKTDAVIWLKSRGLV